MLHLLRIAVRSYRRAPILWSASALILTLAVIGLATALGLARSILFEPLDFARPQRLVAVWPDHSLSQADLVFLREHARTLGGVASVAPGWGMVLDDGGDPARVTADRISANLFALIGARPLLGRTFHGGEDAPNAAAVAVLSYRLWRKQLGGDPRVVGRTVRLDGQPVEVIGVMPQRFEIFHGGVDLWTPMAMDTTAWYHKLSFAQVVGRLAPHANVAAADAELRALVPQWRTALGYSQRFGKDARIADLTTALLGNTRAPVLLLLGSVGLILLIAGANLAALLLVRGMARAREFALRAALGASARRVVAELVVENLTLALGASIAGVLLARRALAALVTMLPAGTPRLGEVALHPSTAATVVLVAVATTCAFATLSALLLTRRYASQGLHHGNRVAPRPLSGAARVLVIAEIALSTMLGLGAGLMLHTLWRLEHVDAGFVDRGVLTFSVDPAGERYQDEAGRIAYNQELRRRLAAIPGVVSVGAVQHLPLSGAEWVGHLEPEGLERKPGDPLPQGGLRVVTPGYFATLGIRRLAGRDFSDADSRPGERAIVVSDELARRFFGGPGSALGKHLRLGDGNSDKTVVPWSTIVGVVAGVHHGDLRTAPGLDVYEPLTPSLAPALSFALRTPGDPLRLAATAHEVVHGLDPGVPMADVQPMTVLVRTATLQPRLLGSLLSALAAIGLLVALSGVYALFAFVVQRGRRDLAVRFALGAPARRAIAQVVGSAVACAALGLALGLPLAIALSRLIRTLLFEVEPTDAMTMAALAVLVLATAAAAAWVPARRAARVDPREALQGD